MKKLKIFVCLMLFYSILFPLPARASAAPSESESNAIVPPETESGLEPDTEPQTEPPKICSSDIIVTRYRMYHGRPQYRRWNETQKRWEDSVWLDGSVPGIKRITLYTGSTMKLKIGSIKPSAASKPVFWKSKKPSVVYACKNGRILAKRNGIAQILAINRKTKRTVAKLKIIVL